MLHSGMDRAVLCSVMGPGSTVQWYGTGQQCAVGQDWAALCSGMGLGSAVGWDGTGQYCAAGWDWAVVCSPARHDAREVISRLTPPITSRVASADPW